MSLTRRASSNNKQQQQYPPPHEEGEVVEINNSDEEEDVEEVVAGDQEHLAVSILILIQTHTILTVYIDGLYGGCRRGTLGHSTGNSRRT
jgi:hypothetical protein